MNRLLCTLALVLLSVVATTAVATTIHVPAEQPTIQAGIDAASYGDTVLVACGRYYEHDVTMKSGVYLTRETGLADCVTVDAQQQGRVFYCGGVDAAASIVGLTITGGLATGSSPGDRGGGMHCYYSSPTLTDCTFSGNQASCGGGMWCCYYSSLTLSACIIAFSQLGEAIYCSGTSIAVLRCCDVYGNAGGDWVGCIADQYGVNGNICEDPLFCGDLNPDEPYTLHSDSLCAPDYNPQCGLIGAWGVGCGSTAVEETSWGSIKAMFR